MPQLQDAYIARGDLALPLRLYLSRTSHHRMPGLFHYPTDGTLSPLPSDEKASMTVRITERDIQILELLAAAGWLSTRQIQYALFPDAITKVVNKRMRKLTEAKHLEKVRLSRTDQNLYRLGNEGKKVVASETNFPEAGIVLMRKPPRELDHFIAINDLRLFFEKEVKKRGGEMKFFFADLELKKRGEQSPIIPDAIMRFVLGGRDYRFAIEYDNGTETSRYFAREKVRKYIHIASAHRAIFSLMEFRVLVFAENSKIALKLMKGSVRENPPSGLFYFAAKSEIAPEDILADIYLDPTEVFSQQRQVSKGEGTTSQQSRILWHFLTEMVSRCGVSTHQGEEDKSFATCEMSSLGKTNIPINSYDNLQIKPGLKVLAAFVNILLLVDLLIFSNLKVVL
jgi:hypothetical protein